jgi:hypothetical protein
MKKAILIKTDAALAIGAVFPLCAIAAQPAETMTERGVIEKKEIPNRLFLGGSISTRDGTFVPPPC